MAGGAAVKIILVCIYLGLLMIISCLMISLYKCELEKKSSFLLILSAG